MELSLRNVKRGISFLMAAIMTAAILQTPMSAEAAGTKMQQEEPVIDKAQVMISNVVTGGNCVAFDVSAPEGVEYYEIAGAVNETHYAGGNLHFTKDGLDSTVEQEFVITPAYAYGSATPTSLTIIPAPQGVTAQSVSGNTIISCEEYENSGEYIFYRSTSGIDGFVEIGAAEMPVYSHRQAAVDAASLYAVGVRDVNGNVSFLSNSVLAQATKRTAFAGGQLHYDFVTAWASGDDGNDVLNAIDNMSSTRWSSNGDGQWAIFELSGIKEIGYVGVSFYTTAARASKFDIAVSEDGSEWVTVISNKSSENSTSARIQPFAFDELNSINAKYIKYIGHGNTTNAWNSVIDLQAYPPADGNPVDSLEVPVENYNPVVFTRPGLYRPDGNDYTPHEPNAVSGETINVADFNAIANDGLDDKEAIQNAINAAQFGEEIYFPNGVYHLKADANTSSMLALKSGVNLRGESKEGVVLLAYFDYTTNRTSVMRLLGKNNIVISDMTIKGDVPDPDYEINTNANTTKTNEPTYLIHIDDIGLGVPSFNIDIENVVLEKAKEMAVRVSKSHDVTIKGITVRNMTDVGGGGAGYGVSIQGMGNKLDRLGYDNDTYFNIVEDSLFEGPFIRHGVLVQYYAHNNLVDGNQFINTALDAIDLHGEDEYLNEIRNNKVRDVLKGGAIGVGNSGATHRNAGPFNYIHDNEFTNCRDGIRVYLESPDTIIENNKIVNATKPENAIGIWIQNAPRTIIRGNEITGNTASGFWGIKLEYDNGDPTNGGAGMPEDVLIENNIVTGNDNGVWIKDGYFITLANNTIENNVHTDLINQSVMLSDVSNYTVAAGNKKLTLNWTNPVKEFFNGVNIYKGNTLVAALPKGVESYEINNLVNGLIYTYTIRAVDKNGSESAGVSAAGSPVGTGAVTSLFPTDDTYVQYVKTDNVWSSRDEAGFGTGTATNHKQLKAKNTSSTKRVTFIKFNASAYSGEVGSVMLNLATGFGTISESSPGNTTVTVYGMSENNWSESTLSWNGAVEKGFFSDKAETSGNTIVVPQNAVNLGKVSITSDTKYYNLDVTDYLADKTIVTFMIIGEYGNGANLNILSKENSKDDDKTKLVIMEDSIVTPEAMLANDKNKLTFDMIKKSNTAQNEITGDLLLVSVGDMNSDITWQSSNENYISNNGTVVRPVALQGNQAVTLTATISNSGLMDTKTFEVVVTMEGSEPLLNVSDKPTVFRINENDTVIKGIGVTGAKVEAVFGGGFKASAVVAAGAWTIVVPSGAALAGGDTISITQAQANKEISSPVLAVVLATPVSQGGAKAVERTSTISTLYKAGAPEQLPQPGDMCYFLDTFYMSAVTELPYLRYDDNSQVKPAVITSSANAYADPNLHADDKDDKLLKFGDIKNTVSENKTQSVYFAIDATKYKNISFSIRFRQKADGSFEINNLNSTAKVSAVIEYSVDGGATYTKIRELNNRGGGTASPVSGESGYLPYYSPEGDNYKDYTKAANILNQKPQSEWRENEDVYTVYLEGADNNSDVRVRIRTNIYEGVAGSEAAYEADKNAISNGNYIAFDNLLIGGIYDPPADVNPTGVEVTPKTVTLVQNQAIKLTASVQPVNSIDNKIVWSSADERIAVVDAETGEVTAKNIGTTTIIATNLFSGLSDFCRVTVEKEADATRVITNFAFKDPLAAGMIDQGKKEIVLRVPKGTDLTHIAAQFKISSSTAVVKVNGVRQESGVTHNNFTAPVIYAVQNISDEVTNYTVRIEEKEASYQNKVYYVSSKEEIDGIMPQLSPGDTVIMKNGTWNDVDIVFAANGTANKLITLKAETQGGVALTGASRITLNGSYLVLDGVSFMGRSERKLDGAVVLDMFSYNCRMTNVVIDDYNPTLPGHFKHHWVWNYGTYNRIDHNSFVRKENDGEMLRLYKGIEHHALIDYNYFGERIANANFSNNLEAIQVGMYMGSGSSWETVPSYSVIEHNYFYKWDGEIEIISVKAHNVVIRYNTIEESVGTVCLRIADNCEVYGNYFFQNNKADSGGIRAYGSGHRIYNNYIEATSGNGQQRSGIVLQSGASSDLNDNQTDVKVAKNIIVANNTVVSGIGVTFGAEPSATKPYAPENIIFVNNVVMNGSNKKSVMNIATPVNSIVKNNYVNPVNPGEPISGSNSLEKAIPSEFEFINTQVYYMLADGIWIPTAQSPVIGTGNVDGVDLSFLTQDIRGKTRGSVLDAGAYQLNGTGAVTNKRLTISDVGPSAESPAAPPVFIGTEYDNPTQKSGSSGQVKAADSKSEYVTLDIAKIDITKESYTLKAAQKEGVSAAILPVGELNALSKKRADSQTVFTIRVEGDTAAYELPLDFTKSIIGFDQILSINKLKPEDIHIRVSMTNLSSDEKLARSVSSSSGLLVIVDFTIDVIDKNTNKTLQTIHDYNQDIVRMIAVPGELAEMPDFYGAFRLNEETNQWMFIPHKSVNINGQMYVSIASSSNSIYAIAENRIEFADVAMDYWGRRSIELAAAKRIAAGMNENDFAPEKQVTRAEFIQMLMNTVPLTDANKNTCSYTDVNEGAWYYDAVAKAEALGLLEAYSQAAFYPQQNMTREEMANICAALIRLKGQRTEEMDWKLSDRYEDFDKVSLLYAEDVQLIVDLNIMKGISNSEFAPNAFATRAQAVTVLLNLLKALQLID